MRCKAKGGAAQQWHRHPLRCCVLETDAPRWVPDGARLYLGVESEALLRSGRMPGAQERPLSFAPQQGQGARPVPPAQGRTGAALPGADGSQNGPGFQRRQRSSPAQLYKLSPAANLLCQTLRCSALPRPGYKPKVVNTVLPAPRTATPGKRHSARTWAQSCSSQRGWCSSTEAKMWL